VSRAEEHPCSGAKWEVRLALSPLRKCRMLAELPLALTPPLPFTPPLTLEVVTIPPAQAELRPGQLARHGGRRERRWRQRGRPLTEGGGWLGLSAVALVYKRLKHMGTGTPRRGPVGSSSLGSLLSVGISS